MQPTGEPPPSQYQPPPSEYQPPPPHYFALPQQQYPPHLASDPGRPAGWPPPGAGGWSAPSGPRSAPAKLKTARPWLVGIVAFATFLVLIAGLGNQWVTDAVNRRARDDNRFGDNAARAGTSYQWRFSPRGGHDFAHLWAGNLALIGTALVLTLLLVAAVARGRGGFGQVFIGAWMAVVVASMLATYVRALVIDTAKVGEPTLSKANAVVFSPLAAGPFVLAASLGFGVIVALVAGLTAVLSRRTEVVGAPAPLGFGGPPPGEPAEVRAADLPAPEPWTAPQPLTDSPPWASPPPGSGPVATAHPSAAEPPVESRDDDESSDDDEQGEIRPSEAPQRTTVLPAVDGPRPGADPSTETTQLPRGTADPTESGGGEPTTVRRVRRTIIRPAG